MLALWGYKESAACPLCKADQCTLHHVLVNCNVALEQGRYTWRHGSVLQNIEKEIQRDLPDFNNRTPSVFSEVPQGLSLLLRS